MEKSIMLERGEQFFNDGFSLYVNRVYEQFDLPVHRHDFIEISYVWEGSGFHYIGDETIRVSKGDWFLIPIGVPHIFRPTSKPAKQHLVVGNCIFNQSLFQQLTAQLPFKGCVEKINAALETGWLQGREAGQELQRIFEQMHEEFMLKRPGYEAVLYGLLVQLLVMLERALAPAAPAGSKPNARAAAVDQIKRYIQEHLHEKIQLQHIADMHKLSVRQIQRLVREATDMTLSEMISLERIKRSCQLLGEPVHGQMTITEIASRVGIADTKQFYRLFKTVTATTPAKYRSLAKQEAAKAKADS